MFHNVYAESAWRTWGQFMTTFVNAVGVVESLTI